MTTAQQLDNLNELLKLASLGHFAENRNPKTKAARAKRDAQVKRDYEMLCDGISTTIEYIIFGKSGAF